MYHYTMSSNNLLHTVNDTLKNLQHIRSRLIRQAEELSSFKGWVLCPESSKKRGGVYYDVILSGSKKKEYLGEESSEQVTGVKRYRYAKEAISVLDKDIDLLSSVLDKYIVPDYQTINGMLPKVYQTNLKSPSSASVSMPGEAIEWKKGLETEKAKYQAYKPEQLKFRAMDGTMMRSKSEVIIANILLQTGIPFVYEAPLFINGKMLLPDFTILSLIDLRSEFIIEHQGMIFSDQYTDKFLRSLKLYLQSEWIPNKNLFFTFDDERGSLDSRQIFNILIKHINPALA